MRRPRFTGLAVPGAAILVAINLLWSCGPGEGKGNEAIVSVDTLAGGRVVISNPDRPASSSEPRPRLVEEFRIGALEGACDAFAQVFSLAVDDVGQIYVADLLTSQIHVFSRGGECLRTFGGPGEGPGEFTMLAGIAWSQAGSLLAIDAAQSRITVFDALGTAVGTHLLESSGSASLPWRLWTDSEGRLHRWDPGQSTIVRYAVGPELIPLDTYSVPRLETEMYERMYEGTAGSMRTLSPIPHSDGVTFAVDRDGEVWLANESAFDLHETTYAGDTLRTIRLRRPPPTLDGRERDSLAAAIGLPDRRLPRHKNVLEEIWVGVDGWIWVERGERPITVWDVFDERGHYIGPIRPPVPVSAEPFPVFGDGTVTAVTEDDLGLQSVVRLRVIR